MKYQIYYTVVYGQISHLHKACFKDKEKANEFSKLYKGEKPTVHRISNPDSLEWFEMNCEYTEKYIAKKININRKENENEIN